MTILRWLTLWPQNAVLLVGTLYILAGWELRKEYQRAKAAGEEWE